MSTQGYILDALTRHQILIQRLAGGQVRESLPILRQMARDIRAALQRQDLTDFQTARLVALQLDIQTVTSAAGVSLRELMTGNMTAFAEYEAQFTQKLLQGAVTVQLAGVSTVALGEALNTAPMSLVSGKRVVNTTFAGIFDVFASGAAREVMTAVQAGISSGATNTEITRLVMGMVNTRTRAQAEAVIITAANKAGSTARAELYRANADVLKGEEWTSVLDLSTTDVCMGRDGKIYPVGEGPQPPAHYRCRSVRVPVVDDRFAVLREGSTRASMQGPVSSKTTYNSWLKSQPSAIQDEVLGVERAKLFRSGVNVDKFTDDAGRTLTLDELRAMEGITLQ
jgi:SPP1 gp7 family putative phage head morphogenesis protein